MAWDRFEFTSPVLQPSCRPVFVFEAECITNSYDTFCRRFILVVFYCHNKSNRLPVTITYICCMSKDSYVILLVKIVIDRLYIKESKTAVDLFQLPN